MLPTFIVAGAAKSGTTAMHEILSAHPNVCMSWMKGPTFFTRQAHRSSYHKGLKWYKNLFQACGSFKAIGEVSPFYMTCEDTPGLIFSTLPDVQLLFVLRDPVERINSYYRYTLHRGFKLPSLEEMITERHPELIQAIHVSSYQIHLSRFLEVFSEEQVKVFIYEDWLSNPQTFVRDIYESIDVDPGFVPPNLGIRYNLSQQARIPKFQHAFNNLGERIIKMDLPPDIFNLLKKIRQKIWQLNSKAMNFPPMEPELRRELEVNFSDTIDFLEEYLGRSLQTWRISTLQSVGKPE